MVRRRQHVGGINPFARHRYGRPEILIAGWSAFTWSAQPLSGLLESPFYAGDWAGAFSFFHTRPGNAAKVRLYCKEKKVFAAFAFGRGWREVSMKRVCKIVGVSLLTAALASSALASHHRHHRRHHGAASAEEAIKLDLSPVNVQPYQAPVATDPKTASFRRRMNLENGVWVKSTRWISKGDVTTRDLFVLDITQSLEGGFDSVNMYDKGVLSWGLMQWTAHAGSLAHELIFTKRRLWASGRKRVWDKVFVAQGLDVDADGLIVYGKPVRTAGEARLAFRGSLLPGNYDPKLAVHWATAFARAGRQPQIADLQAEYAGNTVDAVLNKRLPRLRYHPAGRFGVTAADLAGDDPYAEALIFALWTNNPSNTLSYIAEAAHAARAVSVGNDPTQWVPGAFHDALLRRCHASRFGNWRARTALIEARAQALHTASPAHLTPFERVCQGAMARRKAARLARAPLEVASRTVPGRVDKKNASRHGGKGGRHAGSH